MNVLTVTYCLFSMGMISKLLMDKLFRASWSQTLSWYNYVGRLFVSSKYIRTSHAISDTLRQLAISVRSRDVRDTVTFSTRDFDMLFKSLEQKRSPDDSAIAKLARYVMKNCREYELTLESFDPIHSMDASTLCGSENGNTDRPNIPELNQNTGTERDSKIGETNPTTKQSDNDHHKAAEKMSRIEVQSVHSSVEVVTGRATNSPQSDIEERQSGFAYAYKDTDEASNSTNEPSSVSGYEVSGPEDESSERSTGGAGSKRDESLRRSRETCGSETDSSYSGTNDRSGIEVESIYSDTKQSDELQNENRARNLYAHIFLAFQEWEEFPRSEWQWSEEFASKKKQIDRALWGRNERLADLLDEAADIAKNGVFAAPCQENFHSLFDDKMPRKMVYLH